MELEKALYMIPVPISERDLSYSLPQSNREIVSGIRHFIVENIRSARRFLKKLNPDTIIGELIFFELNGHTPENEISSYLTPLRNGMPIGVLSEAGCPGVADPGATVVRIAQSEGLKVIPLIGPSSILLALMASGLNGQRFCFHGYLPVENEARNKTIKNLEIQSSKLDMTQIFIETPYRNSKMMESLLKNLNGDTLLCVASSVTDPHNEKIITKTVKKWKAENFNIEKTPTIFLFYS